MRLSTKEAQGFRLQQIIALEEVGEKRSKIALITQCSEAWVSKVTRRSQMEGKENVKPKGKAPGHKPALSAEQLAGLQVVLRGLASSSKTRQVRRDGFESQGWTRAKVAQVIEQRYGIKYDLSHISRILEKINFTLQKPKAHDYRKDPLLAGQWKEERLPALKKSPGG